MTRYIIRRLISVIPTLIGVTLVIFMFQRLIPGDPAVAMLGEHAAKENVERIREQLGLNRPMFLDREALVQGDFKKFFDSQYIRYMGRLVRLDLGESIHRRIPVAETLAIRFPATVELALLSLLIAVFIGLPVGIVSAARRNSMLDGATMVGSLIGVSMPIFWLGIDGDHAFCRDLEVAARRRPVKHRDRDQVDHKSLPAGQPAHLEYPWLYRCIPTYHPAGDSPGDDPDGDYRPHDPLEHVGCPSGRLHPDRNRKRPG